MAPTQASDGDVPKDGELEFFGVKLKVRNPHLAALLNSGASEDVRVIGHRAGEVAGGDEDARAELEVRERVLRSDDSVILRLDESEDA